MLAFDENVGNSSLASLLLQGVLNVIAVGDLVELNDLELVALRLKGTLGRVAVGAIALAVHHDCVGSDLAINLIDQVLCHCDLRTSLI